MSVSTELRDSIATAVRNGETIKKNVLRVILGEVQSAEAIEGPISDERIHNIVRKLLKSNEETIAALKDRDETDERITTLKAENAILSDLLPQTWDQSQIEQELRSEAVLASLMDAKSDGQATGVAMKHLKSQNAPILGSDVAPVVSKLRTER